MSIAAPHILIIITAIIAVIVMIAGAGILLALMAWQIREALGLNREPSSEWNTGSC